MSKVILYKEGDPNDGLIIDISPSSVFVMNEILTDPIRFLDSHGALGFTKGWALLSVDILGGNYEQINSVFRINIFNQNVYMEQSWLVVKADRDISNLSLLGQLYNIVQSKIH